MSLVNNIGSHFLLWDTEYTQKVSDRVLLSKSSSRESNISKARGLVRYAELQAPSRPTVGLPNYLMYFD